jgi:hypothetical protein
VPPVKYELAFYIPEEDILHSQRRENLKSCNIIAACIMKQSSIGNYISIQTQKNRHLEPL